MLLTRRPSTEDRISRERLEQLACSLRGQPPLWSGWLQVGVFQPSFLMQYLFTFIFKSKSCTVAVCSNSWRVRSELVIERCGPAQVLCACKTARTLSIFFVAS